MENTAMITPAVDTKKMLRKQKLHFWFGMFGTACLIIIMVLIEKYFAEIFMWLGTNIPGFKDYYNSLTTNDKRTIVNMMFSTIAMSVPAIAGMIIFRMKPTRVLPFKKVKADVFFAVVFFGMGVMMLANIATSLTSSLVEEFGYSTEYTDNSMGDDAIEIILRTISISVFPAFFEEFLFRGAILQSLRKYSCDSFAIFFSAFLFGLVHGNIVQMPFAFLGGIFFAAVTVKTNSILPAMTVHFLNNFMSSIASIINQQFGSSAILNFTYSFVFVLMMTLGVVMIIKLSRKDENMFYTTPNPTMIPEKKMWLYSFLNAAVLACVAFYGYEAITLMLK